MIVIKLTYKVGLDVMDQHRPAHVEWLKAGYAEGLFIASGRQNPPVGGVIIAKGNRAEVAELIKGDPFYALDLADYELTEFTAGIVAPGLEAFKD